MNDLPRHVFKAVSQFRACSFQRIHLNELRHISATKAAQSPLGMRPSFSQTYSPYLKEPPEIALAPRHIPTFIARRHFLFKRRRRSGAPEDSFLKSFNILLSLKLIEYEFPKLNEINYVSRNIRHSLISLLWVR